MKVTLKDIAAEAGVSLMTVSNVVNGNRARVSPATIEKVQRILESRGYVANASARSLAAKSSRVIGLLLPAADDENLLVSPHDVAIVGSLERQLRKRDYHLLLRGISDPAEISQAVRTWSLDGAILLGFRDEEVDGLGGTAPFVAIDSYSANPLTTGVRLDDERGGYLAAQRLLALGHRRILFAGPGFGGAGVVRRRYDGFRRAFDEAGIRLDDRLVRIAGTTHADGLALGREFPESYADVTAVFATADILAIGVMEGLADRGLTVPGDVSVIGFDNLDIGEYVMPKLTTIAQDISMKAITAAGMLLDIIEQEGHPAEPVTLPVSLLERASVGPVRP